MSEPGWMAQTQASPFPFPVPTRADLEAEKDPREQIKVKVKSWHFKMFNLMSAPDVKEYERLRLRLFDKLRSKRCDIVREAVQVLTKDGVQQLYQIVEWVELDFKAVEEATAQALGLAPKPVEQENTDESK